jgi:cation:H+ antiporter
MVGISAIRKGHASLLIGNVVGADVLNMLFVIGASAAATPLHLMNPDAQIPEIFLVLHLPAMLLILLVFQIFIFQAIHKGRFSRWQGIPLLVLYVSYLAMNLVLAK